MIHEVIIPLASHPEAKLTTYIHDDPAELAHAPRPVVLVCGGGGYHFVSKRETEPIALAFLARGFNVFSLEYTVAPEKIRFAALAEVCASILYIRENAAKYNIIPSAISVCGFSAGGHLAASSATLFDIPEMHELFGEDSAAWRPDSVILSYPVITGGKFAHKGSFINLIGSESPSDEDTDFFSLEKRVTPNTCPAFIWHTYDDALVPVENSLLFAASLRRASVPFELHIYEHGPHGLALATSETDCQTADLNDPHASTWIDLAVEWLKGR